jgi:hypothetical protein
MSTCTFVSEGLCSSSSSNTTSVIFRLRTYFTFCIQVDTLVNPFKQASMGIVKGVSKIGGGLTIVSDSVMENAGKIFRTNGNNASRANINLNNDSQTFSIVEETQAEVRGTACLSCR